MRPLVVPITVAALVAAVAAPTAGAATFAAPVEPATIERGCDYGDRECLDPSSRHAGVDYLPHESPEPILASADGIVRVAAEAGSDASHDFGHVVVLEHTLPGGGRVSTVYGHLRDRPAVRPGDCVRRRARLGYMGRTGAATNVHLHFEVKAEPKLGPPYGYTAGDPDDDGFFDPKSFVGQREALDLCAPEPDPDPEPGAEPEPASDCTRGDPRAAFARPLRAGRELRASGRVRRVVPGCRVQLALVRRAGGRCAFWRASRRRMEWRPCASPVWTSAGEALRDGDLTRWAHRFRASLVPGGYELSLRLVDRRGRVHVPAGRGSFEFSLGPPR
jgi:hypothetical protein